MHPPIPSPEPPQRIPLIQRLQPCLHRAVTQVFGAHEVVEHVAGMDEGEDRRDGGGFAGQEGVPATEILDEGGC